jgi:hypothetical protein
MTMGISDDRYLSIHLARVEELTVLDGDARQPPAGEPASWLLGADEGLHASEFASQRSTVFAAVATHHNEESALACAAAAVPEFADAAETWSAALRPTRSHGSCNWVDGGHFDADGERTTGPMAVMTSVGWDLGPTFRLERAVDFGEAVTRVRTAMWSEPVDGMTSHQSFVFPGMLAHDGITFTTWRDEAAAVAFAYRAGAHKTEMDRFRLDETADRTSFTRLRPIETHGTWHGADPLAIG